MEEEEEELEKILLPLPRPSIWFSKFIKLQADILSTCLIAFLSPFLSFLSLFSESFLVEKAKENVESAVQAAARIPSTVVHGSSLLLKRLAVGFIAAVYVGVALTVLLVVSVILGVGLVRIWVEKPLILREDLHFDYTKDHPEVVFAFDGDYGGYKGYHSHMPLVMNKVGRVPVGHTFYVSVLLLLPESDYNREIGIFQLTAETISSNGEIMEKATHPCMVRFRSWPIRMIRTFIMGLPLLLGITAETQTIEVAMLKHKEDFPRSAAVRIFLSPRAGTDFLPQLYEAEILLNSQLPWRKELIRRWKWTFYVWTSMYIYTILLLMILLFFRPLILPVLSRGRSDRRQDIAVKASEENKAKSREESDVSQSLRRWQRSRSKRKAMHLQKDDSQMPEPGESSASSMSLTRDNTGTSLEEETGDSESICYIGCKDQ